MKKTVTSILIALSLTVTLSECKKDKKTDDSIEISNSSNTSAKYALIIDDGAQSMEVGKSISFDAHLVSSTGAVINPGTVTWSSNIGGISDNVFSFNTVTVGIISASVQYEGITYTAAVPVNVQPEKSTQLFAVVPSAIIWATNSGPIQLNTVYLGGSATYAFSSDNSGVASVSGTGLITFNATGNANVKVTATINGKTSDIFVPVMVVGESSVPLPVTKIVVTPPLGELFRGETLQLNAKAFNSKGDDVTSSVTFNYVIVPKEEGDGEPIIAASVNSTGLVKALTIGNAYVKVTASGITAQSEITVNPDTILTVTPFTAYLGTDYSVFPPVQNPDNATFTVITQKVDRTKYKNHDPGFLSAIPNPSNIKWKLPTTGIPQIDDQFKVVTLSNITNNSAKVTAIQGKAGSTFIVAHTDLYGGGAAIIVNP